MNNNEIKNPKVAVESGIKMNDCDYLTSILELEKNMSNDYSIALSEASNNYLYEEYFILFEDTKDMARECYNLMFEYGWYTLEEIDENKLNKKIDCLNKKLEELDI